MVVSGAMVLYLTTVNSLAMALGFAMLFGIFSGPEDPLQSMMLAQYFGRNSYGAILGVVAPFQTVMLGFGPALGTLYREEFGSYTGLYVGLAICYFIAGIFIFMAKLPSLPARASVEAAAQDG